VGAGVKSANSIEGDWIRLRLKTPPRRRAKKLRAPPATRPALIQNRRSQPRHESIHLATGNSGLAGGREARGQGRQSSESIPGVLLDTFYERRVIHAPRHHLVAFTRKCSNDT
jgi:hypothetical protein